MKLLVGTRSPGKTREIRELFAAKADKIFASKKERAAAEAFYQNRNLAPLWLDQGVENARAKDMAISYT